jgi:hypothetical protein
LRAFELRIIQEMETVLGTKRVRNHRRRRTIQKQSSVLEPKIDQTTLIPSRENANEILVLDNFDQMKLELELEFWKKGALGRKTVYRVR